MEQVLLLDVSFGFTDILSLLLRNPITVTVLAVLGLFLIYKAVRAIRRELAKKNGTAKAEPPVIPEQPAQQEVPDEK